MPTKAAAGGLEEHQEELTHRLKIQGFYPVTQKELSGNLVDDHPRAAAVLSIGIRILVKSRVV